MTMTTPVSVENKTTSQYQSAGVIWRQFYFYAISLIDLYKYGNDICYDSMQVNGHVLKLQ